MDIYPLNQDDWFYQEFVPSIQEHVRNNHIDIKSLGHEPIPGFTKGMPSWNKGLSLSEDHKKNLSNSLKGQVQSEKQRKAVAIALKKTVSVLHTCSKCGKQNIIGNHKRWHEDNCGIRKVKSSSVIS